MSLRASENKPLCDGRHEEAGFKDAGHNAVPPRDEPADAGVLQITPRKNGPVLLAGPYRVVDAAGNSTPTMAKAHCAAVAAPIPSPSATDRTTTPASRPTSPDVSARAPDGYPALFFAASAAASARADVEVSRNSRSTIIENDILRFTVSDQPLSVRRIVVKPWHQHDLAVPGYGGLTPWVEVDGVVYTVDYDTHAVEPIASSFGEGRLLDVSGTVRGCR